MKSREALEYLTMEATTDFQKSENSKSNCFKWQKVIENDLEILEIIKEKAKGNRFFKGCLLRMFQEDGEKKTYLDNPPRKIDENYYKIKEWLENGK